MARRRNQVLTAVVVAIGLSLGSVGRAEESIVLENSLLRITVDSQSGEILGITNTAPTRCMPVSTFTSTSTRHEVLAAAWRIAFTPAWV